MDTFIITRISGPYRPFILAPAEGCFGGPSVHHQGLYIKSYREGGRTSPTLSQVNISQISSPHNSNFKSTSPSLQGEVDLKLDFENLEIVLIWTGVKIALGALGSRVEKIEDFYLTHFLLRF